MEAVKDIERVLTKAGQRRYQGESGLAAGRFVAAAADRGLIDVAYAEIDSPFGPLLAATTTRGLLRLAYPSENVDQLLEEIARRISPRVLESPARLDAVRKQLEEYFDRKRKGFDLPVDLALARGFYRRVLTATAAIPFGKLATYREVAGKAGNPRATRAAGNALGANPVPIVVPCHRVVRTGGDLGGYTGGLDRKRFLLALEGALSSR